MDTPGYKFEGSNIQLLILLYIYQGTKATNNIEYIIEKHKSIWPISDSHRGTVDHSVVWGLYH